MKTINCRGKILDLRQPVVMAILNINQDSFYAHSRHVELENIVRQAKIFIQEGASILDIGGVSTRPGAEKVSINEENKRVIPAIEAILNKIPDAIVSVDTFHAEVAKLAMDAGASIINDISAAKFDPEIIEVAREYRAPYVLMHMQGNPQTMQQNPHYDNVVLEVLDFFIENIDLLKQKNLYDVIIDPGFGFGKTISHNYQLLNGVHLFKVLAKPILAGLSRKGMFWKPLHTTAEHVLPATIASNLLALQQGASILRVHDVEATVQTIKTFELMQNNPVITAI